MRKQRILSAVAGAMLIALATNASAAKVVCRSDDAAAAEARALVQDTSEAASQFWAALLVDK